MASSYSVDGVWTQILLEQLLNKGKLDTSTYQKLVIKLINSNYYHTRITAETLEEAAKQSAWKPDRQFEKVAGILSGGNSDDSSAVMVASNFIFKLYTQPLFVADPKVLLFAVLDQLFRSRARGSILLAELINHIRVRFVWLPARQEEIVQLIFDWARRHIF